MKILGRIISIFLFTLVREELFIRRKIANSRFRFSSKGILDVLQIFSTFKLLRIQREESKQREEEENAERRGKETERQRREKERD